MIEKYSGVLIPQRADPCIFLAPDGMYYFTASVPDFDLVEIRRAATIEALPDAPTRVVWRKHETGPMSRYIWAPEIHLVDGVWCIYFAAAGVTDFCTPRLRDSASAALRPTTYTTIHKILNRIPFFRYSRYMIFPQAKRYRYTCTFLVISYKLPWPDARTPP